MHLILSLSLECNSTGISTEKLKKIKIQISGESHV